MEKPTRRREGELVSSKTNIRAAMKLAGGSENSDPALPFESNFRAIPHPNFSSLRPCRAW
jgi:hypothetical protein